MVELFAKGNGKDERWQLGINRCELSDTLMRAFGASVIVSGRMELEGIEDGTPFSTSLRVTNVWVVHNDSWMRAAFHDTRIDILN